MIRVDISIAGTLVRTVFVHGELPNEATADTIARLKASIVVSLSENDAVWKPREPILVLSPRV